MAVQEPDPAGSGNPTDPRGDQLADDVRQSAAPQDRPLSRMAHLRPGQGALLAVAVLVLLAFGWQVGRRQIDRGARVACGSFMPNPSLWQAGSPTPAAPVLAREVNAIAGCAELRGRSIREVERLLGPATLPRTATPTPRTPTPPPGRTTPRAAATTPSQATPGSSPAAVAGLAAGERAWWRAIPSRGLAGRAEVFGVVVGFERGRATQVRRVHRLAPR